MFEIENRIILDKIMFINFITNDKPIQTSGQMQQSGKMIVDKRLVYQGDCVGGRESKSENDMELIIRYRS